MDDTGLLMRLLIIAGALVLVADAFFPDDSPPLLAGFDDPPEFSNPFERASNMSFVMSPVSDDNANPPATATDEFETEARGTDRTHCDTASSASLGGASEFWGCLTAVGTTGGNPQLDTLEPDANQTRLLLNSGDFSFAIFMSNSSTAPSAENLLRAVLVQFQCNSASAEPIQPQFILRKTDRTPLPTAILAGVTCPTGTYANREAFFDFTNLAVTTGDINGGNLYMETGPRPSGAIGSIQVSYVSLTVFYSPARLCPADPIENANCMLAQFLELGINGVLFLWEILVFAASWGSFAFAGFFNLMAVFAWYYDIPGMPDDAQTVISIGVTAILGGIVMVAIKIIRGGGG